MAFTTPCFIRKNTKELRDKLEELGYCEIYVSSEDDIYNNLKTGTDMAGNICRYMQWYQDNTTSGIDCGTNEKLFFSIAALQDDSDFDQYFWYKDKLFKCIGGGSTACMNGDYSIKLENKPGYIDVIKSKLRKATVEELIEYFK